MHNVATPVHLASDDALLKAQERIRLISKAANDIIWWADPANGFTDRQEAWEEFTGQTFEEYRNWGHIAAIHPDDRDRVQAAWFEAAAEKRVCACEYRVYCPSKGGYRHCMARGVPVLDADGNLVEWVGTVSDIHDLKTAQAELTKLNRELESRVRERTAALEAAVMELEEFAHTVSHDLRQALRGIATNAHMLRDLHNLPDDSAYNIQRIEHNAKYLHQLIEDILKLSRLTRYEVRPDTIDLSRLAAEIAEETMERYAGSFEVEVEPNLEGRFDPKLIALLLRCLVDNAFKFSPAGGHIRIRKVNGEFCVSDQGIGVDMRYADKIFQPFERLHRAEEFGGTGIGLATAQRIMRLHGGTIRVESSPGQGASFFFTA